MDDAKVVIGPGLQVSERSVAMVTSNQPAALCSLIGSEQERGFSDHRPAQLAALVWGFSTLIGLGRRGFFPSQM